VDYRSAVLGFSLLFLIHVASRQTYFLRFNSEKCDTKQEFGL